ncbi:MAG: metallophosphoesterase, partial [Tepidiformaceae bacterium]
ADALFCGGDLFEHERVTPDTAELLRSVFSALSPMRVFIAPGNHDWLGPQSLYAQLSWSPNVHIFQSTGLEPVELGEGITLWGAAHRSPAHTDGFLDAFRVDRGGLNIALFHGSERAWFTDQEKGKSAHAPFDAAQIPAAGLDFAFLGHFHKAKDTPYLSYPGNPEPLTFGETGPRGVVIATVEAGQPVSIERRSVASTRVDDLNINLTGCAHRREVRDRITSATKHLSSFARVTLSGVLQPDVDFQPSDIEVIVGPKVQIRLDGVSFAYNLEAIRHEQTIRGQFVQNVLEDSSLPDELRERILVTGLRALDGRTDLAVV